MRVFRIKQYSSIRAEISADIASRFGGDVISIVREEYTNNHTNSIGENATWHVFVRYDPDVVEPARILQAVKKECD